MSVQGRKLQDDDIMYGSRPLDLAQRRLAMRKRFNANNPFAPDNQNNSDAEHDEEREYTLELREKPGAALKNAGDKLQDFNSAVSGLAANMVMGPYGPVPDKKKDNEKDKKKDKPENDTTEWVMVERRFRRPKTPNGHKRLVSQSAAPTPSIFGKAA